MPGHTRHHDISVGLNNKNWEVEIYASDFNLSKRQFLKLRGIQIFSRELINNIKWNWIRVLPYKKNDWMRYLNMFSFCLNLFFIMFLKLSIGKLLGKLPDIIFGSSPQLPSAFVALVLARLFKIPFVFEIRDLWPDVLVHLGGKSQKNILVRFLSRLEKTLYKKSDLNIVLSKGLLSIVQSRGGKNVIWLPNGPDLNKFKFTPLPNENDCFDHKRKFNIMYAGAHGLANALDNVVDAAIILDKNNEPINILLIGDGSEKENLILKSKGLRNIHFLDPISKNEIPQFMNSMDAILLSLDKIPLFRYAVSPNKLYDAYAVGRPIVATVPGMINQEILDNNIGITCEARNPEKLASSIVKLMNKSRTEREKMSFSARKLADKTYSRIKIIELLNKHLLEIIQK